MRLLGYTWAWNQWKVMHMILICSGGKSSQEKVTGTWSSFCWQGTTGSAICLCACQPPLQLGDNLPLPCSFTICFLLRWPMSLKFLHNSLSISFLKTCLFIKLLIRVNNSDLCSASAPDVWQVVSLPLLHFHALLGSSSLCSPSLTFPHSLKNLTLLLISLLAFHLMILLQIPEALFTQIS